MQAIQTNYVPDGALGAMFAGMNAANAEDENEQNLAKLFLANQREQQSMPLDIQSKELANRVQEYQAQLADAKRNDPNYIPMELKGQTAQMQSQITAADKGKALLPFQLKAEQGTLENQASDNDLLSQFRQVDNLIRQGGDIDPQTGQLFKFTPQQQQAAVQRKNSLMESMMNTPKFNQDQILRDDKIASAEKLGQLKATTELEKARIMSEAKIKELEAKIAKMPNSAEAAAVKDIYDRVTQGIITKAQATKELADLVAGKQKINENTGMGVTVDSNGKAIIQPTKPQTGWIPQTELSEQDKQALNWANTNPTDPRSAKIKQRLGVK